MATLTIFTPTYNNEKHIKVLYQTLQKQTCKDFEWLIVDDGSSDNTEELVSSFQQNADFTIRYFYQENKGKYMAHYYAIQQCTTALFCCIDADIALYENIVETMLKEWNDFSSKFSIIGIGMPIICRSYNDLSKVICSFFPDKVPAIGRLSELTSKYGYHGESLYMFNTYILKKLTVPEIPDEKFWTESALYFPLNRNYKVHWLNVPIGESVYQQEGLSNNRLKNEINSPRLTLISYKRGAIYHPLFLHKVANCCLYISWKKIMGLKDEFAERIPPLVLFFAHFLEPVYCRNFRKKVQACLKTMCPKN